MQERDEKNWLPWYILTIAIIFYCLDFFFRISPSLVVTQLMSQYHVSSIGIGIFASAFYLGYVVMQIPTGIVLDNFSLRAAFILAILLCCLSYLWFLIAHNFYLGVGDRFVVGLGSAFSFIGALYIAKRYLPQKFFTLIAGITISLGTLGASLVQIATSFFFKYYSWHLVFEVTAASGFILILLILAFVNRPLAPLKSKRDTSNNLPLWQQISRVLSNSKLLINAIIGGLFYLPTSIFAGLWGISFLQLQYHLSATQSSFAIMLLFLGWAIGAPVIGFFAAKYNRDRLLIMAGALIALICCLLLLYTETLTDTLIYFMLFIIGLASSFQVIVWNVFAKISIQKNQNDGLAIAVTNMIIMAIAALFHIVTGELMNHRYKHLFIAKNINYTISDYHLALSIIPLAFISVTLLAFLSLRGIECE